MADNTSPEEQNIEAREEFPQKLRVHALARLLGLTSKEVLAHLSDLGFLARSAHSSIDRSAAERVRDRIAELAGGDAASEEKPETLDESAPREQQSTPADEPAPMLFSGLATDEVQSDQPVPAPAVDDAMPLFLQPEKVERPKRAPKAAKKQADALDAVQGSDTQSAPAEEREGGEGASAQPHPEGDAAESGGADSGDDATTRESAGRSTDDASDDESTGNRRRRRGRRGRGRGRGENSDEQDSQDESVASDAVDSDGSESSSGADERTDASGGKNAAQDQNVRDQNAQDQKSAKAADAEAQTQGDTDEDASEDSGDDSELDDVTDGSSRRRRRRRRRRAGGGDDADSNSSDDPPNTVVHEREPRQKSRRDEVRGISGSTRLEAKRQRRRDGRDTVRRRPPILTESEFLARREAVDRVMVVRERTGVAPSEGQDGHTVPHPSDYTQVAVLEDGVLVEHFVTSSSSASMVGNIYLGRVQNVLPSMEAAFVDIGRGRNGVLYAGEVNWDAAGLDGNARKIEQALKPGDQVLVQVSKDPVGHKGARLTTQISLAGRFLVYVPGGGSAGISRKLPDTERKRLKEILQEIVPADAGVIIRTASEGVSAEELAGDVARLQAQWAEIEAASSQKGVKALYEEPDLLVKVVRDLFNEDFSKLVIEGRKAWDTVEKYVSTVAPDLLTRVDKFEKAHADAPDVFAAYRIDEQLAKAMDRKVWLPSGGTLVIDRTEAMTVVDVNTGKFTGAGGNLEETVTRNNLEAAEEIVRQMRLRDIGGMIVVDFIDMVLESNRDLVLRRLTEALGRDRTRHQVSEVTSLGLVQMTRKRIGTGLVEAFSTPCHACGGRGIIVHDAPVESAGADDSSRSGDKSDSGNRKKRKRAKSDGGQNSSASNGSGSNGAGRDDKPVHKGEHPMFKAMAAQGDDDPRDAGAQEAPAEASQAADGSPTDDATTDAEQAPTRSGSNRRAGSKRDRQPTATAESSPTVEQDEPVSAEPVSAEPATAAAAPRRRRVARKATTTSSTAETIVVDLGAAQTPPATTVTAVAADGAGESAAEPARKRARRRAAARPAGPAAGGTGEAGKPADTGNDENKVDQPV